MKKKSKIIFIICLIVLIAAVISGTVYLTVQKRRESAYQELAQKVVVPVPEPELQPEPEPVEIPVDFAALQEENPDIYAWIRIPDTKVDYPILQSEGNDDYYLNHTLYHESGIPGAIYTQYSYNHGCFADDRVTVVYGHNMRNDSMFGQLGEYKNEDFRTAHPDIEIYTPEHIYTWRIVFAETFDNRHLLGSFDTTEEEGYERLLAALQTERKIPSWQDESRTITTDDRLLILSTCNGNSSQRYLIGAVLTDEK